MEKQFAVGQVWRNRDGEFRTITHIYAGEMLPIATFEDGEESRTYGVSGKYYGDNGQESHADLVELVTNADGTPASADAAAAQIDGAVFDTSRTEFIDKLTHEVFVRHAGNMDSGELTERVKAAVKLRDELVNGDAK